MIYIMVAKSLGAVLLEARKKAKLSGNKLAKISGVSRQYIAKIEKGERQGRTSVDMIIKLANALEMSPQPFLEAMGAEHQGPDLPQKDRVTNVNDIPVYTEFPFHAGMPTEPVEYYPRAAIKSSAKTIEAYIIHEGNCLAPKIEAGNIIIVDREGAIENGDIVACLIEGELHVARLRKVADELWLENNYRKYQFKECQVAAPIVEVIKRLK